MLSAANISFTENFLTCSDDLQELRKSGKLIFNQVPLLEINGLNITQTEAMIRYIARNHNLYGSNEEERIRCDMIYDAIKDASLGNSGVGMVFKPKEIQEQEKKNMVLKIEKYFPMFDKILENNESGYFVGNKMSFVDVVFLHDLEWVRDCLEKDYINEYPNIKKHEELLKGTESINKYLNSEQKKNFPDEEYVSNVRKVFY